MIFIHQNFLLFFFVKSAFFLFFPVWWYLERVYFFRFIWFHVTSVLLCLFASGFPVVCIWFGLFRPAVCGFIRLFWDYRVYNNLISLLMHKSLLVFRFFLAGHFRGALWRGISKRGI